MTFTWGPIPAATHYNTYRGTIPPGHMRSRPPGAEYDHTCFESDDAHGNGATTAKDGATPAAGNALYYLMDGEHACGEGSLGNASSGAPRPNPLPCPTPP